ncbi:HNH endonuclease [Paenibacillus sp. MER 180]|uniref:HNH endonuclease n=1 Tax=Paenibacillus sp. MER 180 TaxID=2939570 RepID=UPI00203F3E49|nr:HNH endonuclease signature motif containing protein [Paenibacillus sp. MER 180]MCM3294030.1 HNH endonuclease [Paenibacillus sp. MER 180]
MTRKNMKVSKQEIVDYWFSRVDECGLSVDTSEAHKRCWRCGCEKSLERCHIIPASLGGEDAASNLVLLCKRCHIENPNIADPEIMWDWLRAYGTTFYDTFWIKQGIKEYEFIYHKKFNDELKEKSIDLTKFFEIYNEEIQNTSYHYGHPYLNSATLAGVIRTTFKKYEVNYTVRQ